MPILFKVSRADFTLEAAYQSPEFAAFRDTSRLFSRLFAGLEAYGVKLADIRVERGQGRLADFQVVCHLFDFLMTVRARLDRVEVFCSYLANENLKRFSAAAVDALAAIRGQLSADYRAYALSVSLHGALAGIETKDYLVKFNAKTPQLGSLAGNAVGYYFGPAEDRVTSTLTLDVSVVVPGGLYVRPQATWDARLVPVGMLPARAEAFVRLALSAVELELPSPQ